MLSNPDKPQSAPAEGRSPQPDMPGKPLTSKFLRKGNAVREIQDWASDGTAPGFSRHSGQLSDNVTEERMLKSKIMDLSKERYKYMTQSVYDMKQFLDKQKKKSRILQDLLKNIEVDSSSRRKSWPVQLGTSDEGVNHARHAMLDRFDPTKARDRPKEIVELERQQEEERNKRAASQLSMPRLRTPVFQTEPRLLKEKLHLTHCLVFTPSKL
ncbi:uncharacterized protein LOC106153103 [Lingula anatina]|uniref:Uncharacterized protein LOC106153103 n=1 Tax=Lingula anatina TaxID=7574 RepID=A0A1S3HA91_LINAN|nr:uncharacterized protein LOC106153103 [Lingula anatina]XP_013382370.1 uncharacterized protein LOC106153103 [Lingula anatina]XP_013382378.1 uncharacterized protein LOC106153103 [Lingula anatina]XP_013382386.1 uncharacterized protein LOC106153103 [Lingula anatina]|eukprot:XP_013382361.1 uncharacterized protein LOC106153103 [Lingula anatina]